MFDNPFTPIIVDRLKGESPKAKEVNGYLRNIKCCTCGKDEAFTSLANPWTVKCPREENCGDSRNAKELFPDLWERLSERFADSSDPKAIASAYLRSRGIDPSTVDFTQDDHIINNFSYYTVSLPVEGMQQRYPYRILIDTPSSDNKRWQGGESHAGLVYQPDPLKSCDTTQPIYIAESPLDCLSLRQAGLQAVSVFSASEIPKEFYNTLNKNQPIRLAFDNDRGGCQGVLKNLHHLQDEGFTDVAAFLPSEKQKDWNAVLQQHGGEWSITDTEKTKFLNLGSRLTAETSQLCFVVISEGREDHTEIFEYKDKIWKGVKKNNDIISVYELADESLRFKFREVDEYGRHSYHLQVGHNQGRQRAKVIELKAEDMLTNKFAEYAISITENVVTQNRTDLQLLYKFLLNRGDIKTISTTGLFGHDPKSDWFVFGNVAFAPDGTMHLPVKGEDYFQKSSGHYIRPFAEVYASEEQEIIGIGRKLQLSKFAEDVDAAYGARGLLVMGYFIAGLFSTHIFNHYRVFPFLSVVGEANVGKSTLMQIMSRAFAFADREGIPLNETNTRKGVMRTIAAHSSLALCLTEWTNWQDFNESSLKNMSGRGSVQTRAAFTNDNKTINTPLRCALAFVWNNELFRLKPVKQRTITVKFFKEGNSMETRAVSNALFAIPAQDTCTIGAQVLQNRLYYQNHFIEEIENQVKILGDHGIDDQRIARNHAFPLAGVQLFLRQAGLSEQQQQQLMDRVLREAAVSAESKMTKASNRLPNADLCLQIVREAIGSDDAGWIRVERERGCRDESEGPEIYFHMPTFLEKHQRIINGNLLTDELHKHDDFICNCKVRLPISKSSLNVWAFRFEEELEIDDSSYNEDGVTYESDSTPDGLPFEHPEISAAKEVLGDLERNQPVIHVDLLGEECMTEYPELFPDKGKWLLFRNGTPFREAFSVGQHGHVRLSEEF